MVWNKKYLKKSKWDSGLKIGFWNKGGARQPLKEKINEIEQLIKTNGFSVFGIVEANLFLDNDVNDV